MDFITIFSALLRWGLPALAGGAAALLFLAGAYRVYKKVFHGRGTVRKGQAVCGGLLYCWLLLVVGLTSLSRGANFTGTFNPDLFSGYVSAWNNWSLSELQLILFNMLMFAPLGFFFAPFVETGGASAGHAGGLSGGDRLHRAVSAGHRHRHL